MMTTAVIADMDGTLVDVSEVRHHVTAGGRKDFDAFHRASRQCPPHQQALDYVQRQHDAGHKIIVVTARMYRWEELSADWLDEHMPVPYLGPFMRGDRDYRADHEVKRDIYDILVNDGGLSIVGAIDDNPSIIKLWEGLGIPVEIVPGWDTKAAAKFVEQAVTHKHVEEAS